MWYKCQNGYDMNKKLTTLYTGGAMQFFKTLGASSNATIA